MRWQKKLGTAQMAFAAGIVLWWMAFFLTFRHDPANGPEYLAFEGAFPPADLGWLMPLLVVAAWGNLHGFRWGAFPTMMSGAVLVFLGLLDVSFDLQNGIYSRSVADAVLNASVNVACLTFGLASVMWALQRQNR